MKDIDKNIPIEFLSDETMDELRGGTAVVTSKDEPQPEAGDGAQYICCIKV